MKKILSILLSVIMIITLLASCTGEADKKVETTAETSAEKAPSLSKDPVRVFTLKGPTGMGMAPLMHLSDNGNSKLNYEFTVANAADEFTGNIIQGNFEIACVPTNLAAVLDTKTNGAIQVAAVNTLGVLYLLENGNTVNSINDLKGKTIYSAGQGAVPEYALKYILESFNIDCEVVYESEHDVVVQDIMTNTASIALLPEPKVTAALKNENAPKDLRIALDLNELWDAACAANNDQSELYMGCIIVNKNWAEGHKAELEAFLSEYRACVDMVNNDPDTASNIIAEYGIIPKAPLAKAAIPNAKIVVITGEEMTNGLLGFYEILYNYNPQAVGGKVPTESIFYKFD